MFVLLKSIKRRLDSGDFEEIHLNELQAVFGLNILILESSTSDANCPDIISRKKWGSRTAKTVTYQTFPVKNVVIHHTVTSTCSTKLKCSNIMLSIQNYHMDQQGAMTSHTSMDALLR